MATGPHTSTLLSTEAQLRPLVLVIVALAPILAAAILCTTLEHIPHVLWALCALGVIIPTASNQHYLRTHTLTTIGMIPVACAGLLPATLAGALASGMAPGIQFACRIALVALLAVAAIFVWWFVRLRRTYQRHPHIATDAVLIVLGGAIKQGRPCETLARRLDVAARLWHESPQRTIVVTGGPTPDGTTTEAREMARYLMEQDVCAAHIILEEEARNTKENIAYARALLDDASVPGQRCVISSDYHLWRALRDAQELGVALTPIAAPTPRASVPQQWCREVLTILSGR